MIEILQAAILGLVQGITEFLPISSSAHLVFIHSLFPNFNQPGILFDVFLHGGTLVAVLIYYRKILWSLLTFKDTKLLTCLLIGTIPAAVIGFLFNDFFEESFSSVFWAALTLMISGVFNWLVDKPLARNTNKTLDPLSSFIIGIFQALAIVPGISRSSSTIFSGILLGISKEKAAEFSFLLSIPAILGALVLQVTKHGFAVSEPLPYLVGFFISAVVGYWSIGLLLKVLKSKNYKFFAIYCWVVGGLVLLLQFM